jgi:hypothetical protein
MALCQKAKRIIIFMTRHDVLGSFIENVSAASCVFLLIIEYGSIMAL